MESESNVNAPISDTLSATPAVQPAAQPRSGGSGLLVVGLLMATVALAAVFIKRDSGKAKQQASAATTADGPSEVKIGKPAPKLVLKDLNGRTVSLDQLKGKVVLVDFWATWCGPCQVMIPWFVQLRNQYGSKGFEIVGVAMDEPDAERLKTVKEYAEKAKMNYVIVLGDEDTAQAWGGIVGLPTSFIIDRNGNIQSRHMALVGRDILEKEIKGLL